LRKALWLLWLPCVAVFALPVTENQSVTADFTSGPGIVESIFLTLVFDIASPMDPGETVIVDLYDAGGTLVGTDAYTNTSSGTVLGCNCITITPSGITAAFEARVSSGTGNYMELVDVIAVTPTYEATAALSVYSPFVASDPNEPDIPFGDVAALQALGLLPLISHTRTVAADTNIDWLSGGGGDRSELGLFPEDHSAVIAGQVDILSEVLSVALNPPPTTGIAWGHHPNLFWLPYMMTGDATYIAHLESIWPNYCAWRGRTVNDCGFDRKESGRYMAWPLRTLAMLTYLEDAGLTTQTYYRSALDASRDYYLDLIASRARPWDEFRVFGYIFTPYNMLGFVPWQEAFVGQVLNFMVLMGFDDWSPIAQWHYQGLLYQSGDRWDLNAFMGGQGQPGVQVRDYCSHVTTEAEAKACFVLMDWTTYTPFRSEAMPAYLSKPTGVIMPYDPVLRNWDQYGRNGYAWAALAYNNGYDTTGRVFEIADAINARGDTFENKNSYDTTGYNYDALPLNTWVRTGIDSVAEVTTLLENIGFEPNVKYKGTVFGALTSWSSGIIAGDSYYMPWTGGHRGSSLNAIFKLDLKTLTWSIEDEPSDPWAVGYEWSANYWNLNFPENNYSTYYPYEDTPDIDILPDGKPTSRHTQRSFWYDTKRNQVGQPRISAWTYNLDDGATHYSKWQDAAGRDIRLDHYCDTFYDDVDDYIYISTTTKPGYRLPSKFMRYDLATELLDYLEQPLDPIASCWVQNGRTIIGMGGPGGEKWGHFDMDTETWEYGDLAGIADYEYTQEMQVCVYVPEWGKVLRQFNTFPLDGIWYLYDPATNTQVPYTPVGEVDTPNGRLPGKKVFYYPKKKTIIYLHFTVDGDYDIFLMRVG